MIRAAQELFIHMKTKSLAFIHRNDTYFAVGDFYPVVSVFSHYELGNTVSPFLLLDHIGPSILKPTRQSKGVNDHPHRGFETVTLVFSGELEHKDSTGAGGVVQPGEVQWMTAGAGVIHKEVFSEAFSKQGGPFEMIQLWVNLPAKFKMTPPKYQHLRAENIPSIALDDDAGYVRVIAGSWQEFSGPAYTHTPISVIDITLKAGHRLTLPVAESNTALIYMRSGRMQFSEDDEVLTDQGLAVFSNHGENIEVNALTDTKILLLTGEPIQEPIYGRGFFVMNHYEEVIQALEDIKNNQFIS